MAGVSNRVWVVYVGVQHVLTGSEVEAFTDNDLVGGVCPKSSGPKAAKVFYKFGQKYSNMLNLC